MSDSESNFDDGASSDFAPVKPAKTAKPKAPAAKKTDGAAKSRGRPKGAKNDPAKPKATKAAPKAKAAPKPKKKAKADSDEENSDVDMDVDRFDVDESLLADTPPQKKPAPGPKKSSGKPLADIANESFGMDGTEEPASAAKAKKAAGGAKSKYQMVSLILGSSERRH